MMLGGKVKIMQNLENGNIKYKFPFETVYLYVPIIIGMFIFSYVLSLDGSSSSGWSYLFVAIMLAHRVTLRVYKKIVYTHWKNGKTNY